MERNNSAEKGLMLSGGYFLWAGLAEADLAA